MLAEFGRLVAVEVGAVWLGSFEGDGSDLFLCAGVTPILADWRDASASGWVLQGSALAGYRRIFLDGAPDSHEGTEVKHGVRLNVGVELTRDPFTVRALTGLTVPVTQSRTGFWDHDDSELRSIVDAGLDIGVAF